MRNKIEKYRKPLGLSQHRLGKKVGVSRVSINKIETGKVIPSLKLDHDISEALGVCIYKIFDLDGKETSYLKAKQIKKKCRFQKKNRKRWSI
ncbi:helix-turn-helix transcriptional regulator [Lachnoanaerobaculum saburreum]|uniref:DNA-binding helix-turn-helix protein n=1 Tax=Lachnoanaerobaculum saburreum DSM 3986 TaxID=887325 RepID=E6LN59_9FIRM|nr:helix-turn-helix transcriptional regulator [Lachnoanaerobaculum saburreum]EFU76691.1 DNA-binding helix-turn-helix protein [Lachnoanaerobaculum saburreum DSM 3986]